MNLLILLISVCLQVAFSRVYEGALTGKNSFQFLGKFVFDYNPGNGTNDFVGTFELEMDYGSAPTDASNDDLAIYTYYDEVWAKVYGNTGLSCQEKLQLGQPSTPVDFTLKNTNPYCPSLTTPCFSFDEKIVQKLRPRFWYVVVAHSSDCTKSVSVPHYRLEFTNNINGVATQLSFDEYGLVPVYILALILWSLAFIIYIVAYLREGSLSGQSPIIRSFHLSFFLQVVSFVLYVIHWVTYARNGAGYPVLLNVADVVNVISIVLLWIMLAFLSQGYGISKALLSENSYSKLIGALTIGFFVIAYVVMELYYYLGRDLASTEYIYDSIPGIIVCILQVIYAAWCGFNLITTLNNEDGNLKRNWYIVSLFVYGFYFASVPLIAIVGSLLDAWVRFKVVTIVIIAVNTVVYGSSVLLYFPSLVTEIFKLPKKGANFQDDFSGGYENL